MAGQNIRTLEGLITLTREEREAISEFVDILRKRFGSLIEMQNPNFYILFFERQTKTLQIKQKLLVYPCLMF